jgi:CheY-like chemotaxis protein
MAILLDLNMPVMNGVEFRKQQQADPELRHIPVIIMSGEHDLSPIKAEVDLEVLAQNFVSRAISIFVRETGF